MWPDADFQTEPRTSLYDGKYTGGNGDRSLLKGAVAGMAAGLVGAGAMTLFQNAIRNASASSHRPDSHGAQADQPHEDGEDATMKTAEGVAETLTGEGLTREQKHKGGTLVHFAFGATMGAVYGALAELTPRSRYAHGAPFGAAVWAGADEFMIPALGLSKGPTSYPLSTHAQSLASHIVYGLTTDTVHRLVRRAL